MLNPPPLLKQSISNIMPSGVVEDAPPDSNLHQQPEAPEWEKFTTEVCQLINKTRKVKKGKKTLKFPTMVM